MQAGKSRTLCPVTGPQEEEVTLSTWSSLISAFWFGAWPIERSADSCLRRLTVTFLRLSKWHAGVKTVLFSLTDHMIWAVEQPPLTTRSEVEPSTITRTQSPCSSLQRAYHYLKTYRGMLSVCHSFLSPTGMEANSLSARPRSCIPFPIHRNKPRPST